MFLRVGLGSEIECAVLLEPVAVDGFSRPLKLAVIVQLIQHLA